MMDQTEFLMLSDVNKWREYRDADEMMRRLKSQLENAQDTIDIVERYDKELLAQIHDKARRLTKRCDDLADAFKNAWRDKETARLFSEVASGCSGIAEMAKGTA